MSPARAERPIEVEAARELVLERARERRAGAETVPLDDALGRVLAADAVAALPVPGFDNSAMDGFALRAADTAGAAAGDAIELEVVGESRAGRPCERGLGAGEAIAISTGAMLPDGADAVAPIEEVERRGGWVEPAGAVAPGANLRRTGDDIVAGEVVLREGAELGAAELGVLASIGEARVACRRRPRVVVVVSGDELVPPGGSLGRGQIHDANAHTLPALARRWGAEPRGPVAVGDERGATVEALRGALDVDLVLVSGGVSVGAHDHVKAALDELGVEQVFWRIALRPGKPTWFGVHGDGALVLGLPGNPVSAMVCATLLGRPAVRAMLGTDPGARRTTAVLDAGYEKRPDRAHAVRCTLELGEDGWHATPTGEQASHVLTSMLGADALALIPTDAGPLPAGARVEVELLA